MAVSFTTSGYIEVWSNGQYISRHRSEDEARESALNRGPGTYEIRRPTTKIVVTSPSMGEVTITGVIIGDA